MRTFVALIALVVAAGPAKPVVSYYPDTNFNNFRSYSWVFRTPPSGMDANLYRQIHHAVDQSLTAHGFVRSNEGDFAVAFTLGPREKVHAGDYGHYSYYYSGKEAAAHKTWINNELAEMSTHEHTLAIDIYDRYSKQAVWHGVAPVPILPNTRHSIVEHEVDNVLSLFPPKPGT